MLRLRQMVGETVKGVVLFIHQTRILDLKIHGIEFGGIWLECQNVTEGMLARIGEQSAPKTPIVFVPYSQIKFLLSSIDAPALSERGFGV